MILYLLMMNFSAGSELVYHRLPWKEPDAPYLIEVLYEDDDMVICLNYASLCAYAPKCVYTCSSKTCQWQFRKSLGGHNQAIWRLPINFLEEIMG